MRKEREKGEKKKSRKKKLTSPSLQLRIRRRRGITIPNRIKIRRTLPLTKHEPLQRRRRFTRHKLAGFWHRVGAGGIQNPIRQAKQRRNLVGNPGDISRQGRSAGGSGSEAHRPFLQGKGVAEEAETEGNPDRGVDDRGEDAVAEVWGGDWRGWGGVVGGLGGWSGGDEGWGEGKEGKREEGGEEEGAWCMHFFLFFWVG